MSIGCRQVLSRFLSFPAGKGISQEVVHVVTAQLKAILGLTLFGYDVIVEEHSGSQAFWLC